MGYQEDIESYNKEKDPQKRLKIAKRLFLESLRTDTKSIPRWLNELCAMKPQEESLQELAVCPKCGQFMSKVEEFNIPPRARVLYYKCKACMILRAVGYLSMASRNVVELETVDIKEDKHSLEEEVKFMLAEGRTDETVTLLEAVIKANEKPETTLFSSKKLIDILLEQSNYEKAIPSLEGLIKMIRTSGDKGELSNFLQIYSAVLLIQEKASEALEVLSELMKIATELDDPHLKASTNLNIGVAMELLGEYDKAMDYYTAGLELSEEHEFDELFDDASQKINSLVEKMQAE